MTHPITGLPTKHYDSLTHNPRNARVLLCVVGMSPAVVTETLHALKHSASPFIPTRIIVVTTKKGAQQVETQLCDPNKRAFFSYCHDYDLDPQVFQPEHDLMRISHQGADLDDIVTEDDNRRVANTFTEVIKQLTSKNGSEQLHVSMAGGRKTMGYYAGYALSLMGRAQDKLSHVLVSEPFEQCRGFFYPTPTEHFVDHFQEKTSHNAQDAHVSLAEIPYVRVKNKIPPALLHGSLTFDDTVACANFSEDNIHLGFKQNDLAFYLNGIRIPCDKLPDKVNKKTGNIDLKAEKTGLYFLKVLLERRKNNDFLSSQNDQKSQEKNGFEMVKSLLFFNSSLSLENITTHKKLFGMLEEYVDENLAALSRKTINSLLKEPSQGIQGYKDTFDYWCVNELDENESCFSYKDNTLTSAASSCKELTQQTLGDNLWRLVCPEPAKNNRNQYISQAIERTIKMLDQ